MTDLVRRDVRWMLRGCVLPLVLLSTSLAAQPVPGAAPEWAAPVVVATGAGERGPWRQNDSRYDHVDDPAVALEAGGGLVVAWVDQARKDILLQRYDRDGRPRRTSPVNVSRSPATFSWLPRVALAPDRDRQVFVLWQEIIFSGGSHGGDILFARSDDGAAFTTPLNLSRSIGGDGKGRITPEHWDNGSLDLAVDAGGVVHVTWTEYDGPLWYARSTDAGGRFSVPRRTAGSVAAPARAPSLALGAGGLVYLAFTLGGRNDAEADIHLARSIDGGASFETPRVVARSPQHSDAPRLASSPDGTLHLVHAESTAGPFDPRRIRYARSADQGLSFGVSRELPLPAGALGAAFPQIAADPRGRILVLWESWVAPGDRPRGLGLAVSRDGGRHFDPPLQVPHTLPPGTGTNGSHQGLLTDKLALGHDGRLAIANSSLRPGIDSRVWVVPGKIN